jgi:hypothetical protein
MDGASLDLIIIPIVVVVSLAAWLIAVAYAATHPRWRNDAPARASSADRARTATGGPILDFGPARVSEDHAQDEHVGQVAARAGPARRRQQPLTARGGRLPPPPRSGPPCPSDAKARSAALCSRCANT